MKYKEFDLERALAGEPVVLRDGRKAYVRHHETELNVEYPLMGVFDVAGDASWTSWRSDGTCLSSRESKTDIIGMWKEKPVVPDIVWQVIHPEVVAIAMDKNGGWYAYRSSAPYKGSSTWTTDGGCYQLDVIAHLLPDVHWEDSLILRPEVTSD